MTKKGFTLLEILLAVGAISILASIVIVAINPGKQLATARNTTRLVDVNTIANAIYQYTLDHDGQSPGAIVSSTYTMLGASASGCGITCSGETNNSNWNSSQSFGDQSANDFNAGSLNNLSYDTTNSGLRLTSGTNGDFTSRAFDSASVGTTWQTLIWTPFFPSGKELPNNGGSETGYTSGNMNMNGNVLLMHLDEAAGASFFTDNSGNNNNGGCSGVNCPTTGVAGQLDKGAQFNGVGDIITVPNQPILNFGAGQDFTLSLWIKTSNPISADYRQAFIGKQFSGSGPGYGMRGTATNQIEFWSSPDATVVCPCSFLDNNWHYLVGVRTGTTKIFYFDGEPKAIVNSGSSNLTTIYPMYIGGRGAYSTITYGGSLDEIAIFNRALSAMEVKNMYLRGAARLKLQVRSCADGACSGQTFKGPDGTANTFYSELSNATLSPPSFSLSNVLANRYFQYKTFFESDSGSLSPLLKTVSVSANVPAPVSSSGSSESTADACLDLNSTLVNGGYVSALPFDPKTGSAANTYYAVKAADHGKIMVKSCRSELGQDITTVR